MQRPQGKKEGGGNPAASHGPISTSRTSIGSTEGSGRSAKKKKRKRPKIKGLIEERKRRGKSSCSVDSGRRVGTREKNPGRITEKFYDTSYKQLTREKLQYLKQQVKKEIFLASVFCIVHAVGGKGDGARRCAPAKGIHLRQTKVKGLGKKGSKEEEEEPIRANTEVSRSALERVRDRNRAIRMDSTQKKALESSRKWVENSPEAKKSTGGKGKGSRGNPRV